VNERAVVLPQKIASPANTPVQHGLLQRKCACGGAPGPTGECEQCKRKRLALQRKLTINEPGDHYEQEADRAAAIVTNESATGMFRANLPKSSDLPTAGEAPAIVYEVLASSGQPLSRKTATEMSRRFGYDFSRVRIHTDAVANESAQAVQAQAYTVGEHIVFDSGRYSPGTTNGKKLLAHELTHVVQQTESYSAPTCQRQRVTGTHQPGGPSLHPAGA